MACVGVETSTRLRERLFELYVAMSSGEAALVEAMYSVQPGSCFIGTDASEFWTDPHQHNDDVRHFFDGSSGSSSWRPGSEVVAVVEGTVGWTVDRPSIRLGDGTVYDGLRVTLVWHLEKDDWVVVHSHASVGQS
jgi:hypothetical protein